VRDWEADRFRRRRVECLYDLKEGEKAYAEVGPAEETFSQLAFAYQQDKNWPALEKMIAAHRQKHPNDRNGPYWAANVLYQRGNYPEAAAAFTRYLADATEKDPNDYMATDLGTRALLRSGKPHEAEQVVKKAQDNRVALTLRVAVALANGHTDDAESIVAEHVKNGARYDFLYYDEDFRREVAAPKFAEFRKKFPDTRPKPKEKDKEE
ncbi:MAG TPA: hypothetical protein VLM40_02670, partial [Gemmata sp.]|nr:hypothetical protein [Gemmata sp.]